LDEGSVPISALVAPFGHFEWRYMPFGLCSAPATFSRIVYLRHDCIGRQQSLLEFGIVLAILDGQLYEGFAGQVSL